MIIYVLFPYLFCLVISSPEEAQLYDDLLKDYNPYERPVVHAHDNVTVSVGLVLQQIVDVVRFGGQ